MESLSDSKIVPWYVLYRQESVKFRASLRQQKWRRHIRAKRVPYITQKEQQASSRDAADANINSKQMHSTNERSSIINANS
ncbi:hypothetical protein WN51_13010 [Melipona quadrifasciata]|uniref:Uncharacterized protein n=1 Tax=Melipona quadrifasciata TaxID=166423 RepID=A0A0M9ABM7_9HYME|nr:hypothetical protein WN51_13010 [Melipona quadrifasciata]